MSNSWQKQEGIMEQCRFCFDWISTSTFKQHEAPCKQKLGAACKLCSKWVSKKHIDTHEQFCKLNKPTEKVGCKFCGRLCLAGMGLEKHQMFHCKKATHCNWCGKFFEAGEEYTKHQNLCEIDHEKQMKQNFRQCRFCQKTLREDLLHFHERSCKQCKQCKFCSKFYTVSAIHHHERCCNQKTKSCTKENNSIACRFCQKKVSKNYHPSHERACEIACRKLLKKGKCRYCHGWFVLSGPLQRHEVTCKWKTHVVCDSCSKLVPKCELQMHEKSCEAWKCRYCQRSFVHSGSLQHEAICKYEMAVVCISCSKWVPKRELKMHERSCREGKCMHCSNIFAISALRDHESGCASKQSDCFQQCNSCQGWFRLDKLPHHKCISEKNPQSQPDIIPKYGAVCAPILVISAVSSDNINPCASDSINPCGYVPAANSVSETSSSGLSGESWKTNYNTTFDQMNGTKARSNAEAAEWCGDESTEQITDFKGNVVVIKPESDTNILQGYGTGNASLMLHEMEMNTSQSYGNENVFVIKPESDQENLESLMDVNKLIVKSETMTDTSQSYRTESKLGIKPERDHAMKSESESDVSEPWISGNALLIKPEDNEIHREGCSSPGVKWEAETGHNLGSDQSDLFAESGPDVLYCN